MANITTTQVRLIYNQSPPQADDVLAMLLEPDGKSYYVPTHVRQDVVNQCIDLQYGARWFPVHIEDVWEKYQSVLDAMWCRFYDEGGDHDSILWRDHATENRRQLCRYGFDELHILWGDNINIEETDLEWEKQGDTWTVQTEGSYLAANNRSDLMNNMPRIKTNTTSVWARGCRDLYWTLDEITPALGNLASIVEHVAERIEFYWKKRLVRAKYKYNETSQRGTPINWYDYCLDDWDNCFDENWLVYKNTLFKE